MPQRWVRLVDWLVLGAVLFVLYAILLGFTAGSDRMVMISGSLSCVFWLAASALPIYWSKLRDEVETVNGLNAFAAGATGAAVIASIDHGWRAVFG